MRKKKKAYMAAEASVWKDTVQIFALVFSLLCDLGQHVRFC